MFGEPANILIPVYNLRKKSGLSSGGIILFRPPEFGPLFGRPAIRYAIAPIGSIKMMIKIHAHFGKFFGSLVRAQSISE